MDHWGSTSILKKVEIKNQWFGEDEEEDVMDSWDQDVELETNSSSSAEPVKRTDSGFNGNEVDEHNGSIDGDSKHDRVIKDSGDSDGKINSVLNKVQEDVLEKINKCEKEAHYAEFVKDLVSVLCRDMSSSDTKRIHHLLGNMYIDKSKDDRSQEKPSKSKSKLKAKLRVDNEIDVWQHQYNDEFLHF